MHSTRSFPKTVLATLAFCLAPALAWAGCFPSVQNQPHLQFASLQQTLQITYLGHSSFELLSKGGVRAVTDYNGVHRPEIIPDIVTMNNAHSTHFTSLIEPEIQQALQGWGTNNTIAEHDVSVEDMRVRNIPTSVHGRTGAQANSNSIFVFEIEDLCVAHLGHLHHMLTDVHLGELGIIDILLVPIDGAYTMSQEEMAQVVRQVRPSIMIPMHFWSDAAVERFASLLPQGWSLRWNYSSSIEVSKFSLPYREVVVLAPRSF